MFRFGIILFLISFSAVNLWGCSPRGGGIQQVCFDGQCIQVDAAVTQEERSKGLQFLKSMDRDQGMLFIFPASRRQSFWMKDTYIPLDIIWMDGRKRIVFIIPNVLPCETDQCPVYTPDADAQYVLEVNAGVAAELGLGVGDQAVF